MRRAAWAAFLAFCLVAATGRDCRSEDDPDDVKDIPTQDLKAGGDANKRYLLHGPMKDEAPPAEGYGLVVVLPGGDGGANQRPFVKRIYKEVLKGRYVVAQIAAVKWTEDQAIIWPTAKSRVPAMKFTTEELVEETIDEIRKARKIDPARIFTLSWSSGGPAAYVLSTRPRKLVTGSFVAMSVFKPDQMELKEAKGHAYFLFHSEEDKVCPFRMAEQARDSLREKGARVEMKTYPGGHGWRGNVYGNIRAGIEWLEKNHAAPRGK